MKKILIVIGTRPEAIKMAPLISALRAYPKQLQTKVCATAQHREMLDQVLDIFQIRPDYDLNLMQSGQDLFDLSTKVLLGVKKVIDDYAPDLVLVHGDTTTSVMSALAAFYSHVHVAHVEAGLRTYNPSAPWPEEINRQITTRIADFHFAPTEKARQNLMAEGVPEQKIMVTGNTVIDALFKALHRITSDTSLMSALHAEISNLLEGISFDFERQRVILVTSHRRENFGQGLMNICHALSTIAQNNPQVHIIYSVHRNPNVQQPVYEILEGTQNIHLIKPLEYLPFLYLMNKSYFILTDSGGIQEEAPSLGKPILVMRNVTERPEAVEAGIVKLVGTDKDVIITECQRLIDDNRYYENMSKAQNPYGDGRAAHRIVDTILARLQQMNDSI